MVADAGAAARRINQIYLVLVLFEHLSSMPGVRVLSGASLADFSAEPGGCHRICAGARYSRGNSSIPPISGRLVMVAALWSVTGSAGG